MTSSDDTMLTHRKAKFAIETELVREAYRLEPNQISLSMTFNGFQWTSFDILESEAASLIKALEDAFPSLNKQGKDND